MFNALFIGFIVCLAVHSAVSTPAPSTSDNRCVLNATLQRCVPNTSLPPGGACGSDGQTSCTMVMLAATTGLGGARGCKCAAPSTPSPIVGTDNRCVLNATNQQCMPNNKLPPGGACGTDGQTSCTMVMLPAAAGVGGARGCKCEGKSTSPQQTSNRCMVDTSGRCVPNSSLPPGGACGSDGQTSCDFSLGGTSGGSLGGARMCTCKARSPSG